MTPLLRPSQRWRKSSKHRIAIDWFNTTYLARCNGVPPMNVEALQKLHSHGFDLLLFSYCGWKREQEVKSLAWGLPVALHFTRQKAGEEGKCAWMEHLHCGKTIDDDVEVLWEAEQHGLQYYAIQTPKKRHQWCRRGSSGGHPGRTMTSLRMVSPTSFDKRLVGRALTKSSARKLFCPKLSKSEESFVKTLLPKLFCQKFHLLDALEPALFAS